MEKQTDIQLKAREFVSKLCRRYFVEHDFNAVKEMLHKNIIWAGVGVDKIYHGIEATVAMFENEGEFWKEKTEIIGEFFDSFQAVPNGVMVTGELKVKTMWNEEAIEKRYRFSMLCIMENQDFYLLHAHCSRPFDAKEEMVSLQKKEEELRISEKRYEIAIVSSELTMFEYDILTKDLIFYNNVESMYNLPSVVPNGPETLIERGTVEPSTVPAYREMYRRIHAGEPKASCFITTKDTDGILYDFELSLTTLYDRDGRPIRAIGVRKNVSQIMRLQKEKEFGKTLVAGRDFVCEADISNNEITDINIDWAKKYKLSGKPNVPQLVEWACHNLISPEYTELIRTKLNSEYLRTIFEKGENLVLLDFVSRDEHSQWSWHEGMVNVIKDERTGDLHARFYYKDIQERKTKEERALEQQRMYESVIDKALFACEVNITKNLMVCGHEVKEWSYHLGQSNEYSHMIEILVKKGSYADDIKELKNMLYRGNVLKQFYEGQRQIVSHGRKADGNGEYKWVSFTLNMFEDPDSGDVKGFLYLEDIDKQKKEELTLKFNAEHDLMTRLYNKMTTVEKIKEFLAEEGSKKDKHAFFMMDIDNFKKVNDQYGHPFGDMVLCDVAATLSSLFREGDIVGRMGGDEFGVFLKNISSKEMVCKKAEEICKRLYKEYHKDEKTCIVSASIGVALYPLSGMAYEELFCSADSALYEAKEKGRNGYCLSE